MSTSRNLKRLLAQVPFCQCRSCGGYDVHERKFTVALCHACLLTIVKFERVPGSCATIMHIHNATGRSFLVQIEPGQSLIHYENYYERLALGD